MSKLTPPDDNTKAYAEVYDATFFAQQQAMAIRGVVKRELRTRDKHDVAHLRVLEKLLNDLDERLADIPKSISDGTRH